MDTVELGVLAAGFILNLLLFTRIHAWVAKQHPTEKEELGSPFASISHEAQWAGFILVGHFASRDWLLSLLCVAHVAIWLALMLLLFGFWSPNMFLD